MSSESELLLERVKAATEDEYAIEGELGRGGMAVVYLARDIALDRRVAIKVMLPNLSETAEIQDRFATEARTVAHLDHPNIVTVYSVKQRAGLRCFVMKYIEGRTLDAVLKDPRPIEPPVVAEIVGQIAEALHFAHGEGIVHRDIKPSNIILDRRGRPVVTDFGIAKVSSGRSLTMTGSMIGTPAYMSPEQCKGLTATAASDQYSLGVVAYEMLARRPPFEGSLWELIQAHGTLKPEPLAELVPGLDAELAETVHRMLAKDPGERWPSMGDVVGRLAGGHRRGRRSPDVQATLVELARDRGSRARGVPGGASESGAGRDTDADETSTPAPGLVVTPSEPEIELGESLHLRVSDASGGSLAGVQIRWKSEDPSVATVDDDGRVSGRSVGLARITASAGDRSGRAAVSVREPRPDTVVVTPQSPRFTVDHELQFVATVLDARGTVIPRPDIVWSSSDVGVCAVSREGRAIGISPGRATITAQLGQVSGTAQARVLPQSVERVAVEPEDPELEVGESVRLSATVFGQGDRRLLEREVTWRSSVPTVVEVAPDGTARALAPGTAAIVAACEGKEGLASISVRARPPASVRIQPARLELEVGRSIQLEATPVDRSGSAIVGAPLQWESDDTDVVLVDASGKVHGVAEGKTRVRASAGDAEAAIEVTVVSRPAGQIRLEPHRPTLEVGERITLEASVLDAEGVPLPGSDIVWSSSDPSVVEVSPEGIAEGRRPGSARITAVSQRARATTRLAVQSPAATVLATPGVQWRPGGGGGEPSSGPPRAAAGNGADRTRRRRAALAGGGGILVLVALGTVFLLARSPAEVPSEGGLAEGQAGGVPIEAVAEGEEALREGQPPDAGALAEAPDRASGEPRGPAVPPTGDRAGAPSVREADPGPAALPREETPPPPRADAATDVRPEPETPPGPAPAEPSAAAPPREDPAVAAAAAARAERALLCEDRGAAERALSEALAGDPAQRLDALYRPAGDADRRQKDSLLGTLRGVQRLQVVARPIRNEAAGDACDWIVGMDLTWTNAFGQPRGTAGQIRLRLEAEGGRARLGHLFGFSGS